MVDSSSQSEHAPRVAVVGGGITGLAAAHRLLSLLPSARVVVLEAAARPGGILHTERIGGYLVERSADNFVTNFPWGVDLCRELGMEGELLETEPTRRKALIVRKGKLHPVPAGFQLLTPSRLWPMATSPLLSIRGKLRVLGEYFVPRRVDEADESLESFAVRRLGREAYERIVQPLVGGIYTADPTKLSMQAALPRFCELEKEHRSLIRAARKVGAGEAATQRSASGARYGLFVAPRDGMGRIIEALVERLPPDCIRLNTAVKSVSRTPEGWRIETDGSPAEAFDALIATPGAPVAAKLLTDVDAELAAELAKIPYAGASVAIAGYELKQIEHPLDAFGFVVPEIERRDILAASFSSRKFPGRAPEGRVLIRVFLGGAMRPDLVERSDDELRRIVAGELRELLGARGEPELFLVQRWRQAMPQYHVGHLDVVRKIEERAGGLPNFALAGNAYRGVGLPQCVRSARAAAERIAAELTPRKQR